MGTWSGVPSSPLSQFPIVLQTAIVLIVPIVLCLSLRALLFLYHINSGAWQGESPTRFLFGFS
ncbi:unnamed protein product, partial [Mycena citricolor]